jgi:hypothetical protein
MWFNGVMTRNESAIKQARYIVRERDTLGCRYTVRDTWIGNVQVGLPHGARYLAQKDADERNEKCFQLRYRATR